MPRSSTDPTSSPKIVATLRFPPDVEARLTKTYDAVLNPSNSAYTPDRLISLCKGASGLLAAPGVLYDAAFIDRLPDSIKVIATVSVGYDHIDVEAAKKRGILVTNTPDVLTDATADIALLLLLGAARRAGEGHEMVRQGKWSGWHTTFMLGKHVTGARLGIFGMGRIGRAVAKRAKAFDMEIHYHNRARLSPKLEDGAIFHDSLESLLRISDFFSIHTDSNDTTRAALNDKTISWLPQGSVVVNTARGEIIDDDALIAALKTGHVAAAGLDVFTGEPNPHAAYKTLKNVFLLPHLGSATITTRNAMGFRALDNLDAYFAGAAIRDAVN